MRESGPNKVYIDLGALESNFAMISRLAPSQEVIGVVKANAYGHGAVQVSRRLIDSGCRSLAVSSVWEAHELFEQGIRATILVLGGVHSENEAESAIALGLVTVVHGPEEVALLSRVAARRHTKARVQVEVDTGMHRLGVPLEGATSLCQKIEESRPLILEGVYTHLARADEEDPGPSTHQLRLFSRFLKGLGTRNIKVPQTHVANSAALLSGIAQKELGLGCNAVRPGILLYGVVPNTRPDLLDLAFEPRPVMKFVTQIVSLRRLPAGEGVGYGAQFKTELPCLIGTLPVGYADGIPRNASGKASFWHKGRVVPIVGAVSMDSTTVNLGDNPATIGDQVVIFGPELGVESFARATGTIPYEILARIGERVGRKFDS